MVALSVNNYWTICLRLASQLLVFYSEPAPWFSCWFHLELVYMIQMPSAVVHSHIAGFVWGCFFQHDGLQNSRVRKSITN